jgi:hypothetical protein
MTQGQTQGHYNYTGASSIFTLTGLGKGDKVVISVP